MRILQWTDSHGDTVGSNMAINIFNSSTGIDMFLHTGDVCLNNFSDPLPTVWNTCYTVGNHDAITYAGNFAPGGMDWTQQPSQQEKVAKFFSRSANGASTQMTRPNSTATWWHHDFKNDGVRMLGLDYTVRGSVFAKEVEWLKDQIEYALRNNVPLIIATHQMPSGCVELDSNFDNPRFVKQYGVASTIAFAQYYPFLEESAHILWKACDWYGLKILWWMLGHTHADMMFVSPTRTPHPLITLTSTLMYPISNADPVDDCRYSNLVRVSRPGYVENAACNLYDYNPQRNTLQIYRLGGRVSRTGKKRNMIIWDYSVHRMLTNTYTQYPFEVLGYTR